MSAGNINFVAVEFDIIQSSVVKMFSTLHLGPDAAYSIFFRAHILSIRLLKASAEFYNVYSLLLQKTVLLKYMEGSREPNGSPQSSEKSVAAMSSPMGTIFVER